jgi:hypothetical protein
MKKALALALGLCCVGGAAALSAHDDDSVVTWQNIAGVITAPGVDNPVAVTTDANNNVLSQIHSGTLPWTTRDGSASVDLTSGAVRFAVTARAERRERHRHASLQSRQHGRQAAAGGHRHAAN